MHRDDSRFYALVPALLRCLVGPDGVLGFVFPVHYLIFDLRNRVAGAEYGLLGVELLFVISGFVILQSAEGKTVAGFAWSRAKRLYPKFWICCTLTALMTAGFTGFAANLTMHCKPSTSTVQTLEMAETPSDSVDRNSGRP